MTHRFLNRFFLLSTCLLAICVAGCEESYKPAAYKAAPRVDAAAGKSTSKLTGQASLPDVTDWTSPETIRATRSNPRAFRTYRGDSYRGMGRGYGGIGAYRGISGYRGIGAYRGIAPRGYSGVAPRGVRSGSQSKVYRGYPRNRNYRGN